ncbi:unnamed protein product, partial [Prorocentrum cordatum]
METALPDVLRGVPLRREPPLEILPGVESCPGCKISLGSHRRRAPLRLYGASPQSRCGVAIERRCTCCGRFFLGPWSRTRHNTKTGDYPVQRLRFHPDAEIGDVSSRQLPTPTIARRARPKTSSSPAASYGSADFAAGLDGKRGAKRFLRACLEGPPRHVPEVDAWLQQGCPRPPLQAGLHCADHDAVAE